jgi:large subunit ribosomal protein L31
MKNDIHPNYDLCEVTCVCGNTFQTRSVKPSIKVEICAACHPFYTGKQKLLDTAGRVEKFNTKFAATGGKMVERKAKKVAVKAVSPRHTVKRKLSSAAAVGKKDEKAAAPAKAAKPAAAPKPEAK